MRKWILPILLVAALVLAACPAPAHASAPAETGGEEAGAAPQRAQFSTTLCTAIRSREKSTRSWSPCSRNRPAST